MWQHMRNTRYFLRLLTAPHISQRLYSLPQEQRYEAASTVYGPHTLSAYIQEFSNLALALATVSNYHTCTMCFTHTHARTRTCMHSHTLTHTHAHARTHHRGNLYLRALLPLTTYPNNCHSCHLSFMMEYLLAKIMETFMKTSHHNTPW